MVVLAGVTRKAMVYFSQETQQSWSSGVDTLNAEAQQHEEGDVDGGALWLPGNVILELQMLPMVRSVLQRKYASVFAAHALLHFTPRRGTLAHLSTITCFALLSVGCEVPWGLMQCSMQCSVEPILTFAWSVGCKGKCCCPLPSLCPSRSAASLIECHTFIVLLLT